jgi:hypothetical protein
VRTTDQEEYPFSIQSCAVSHLQRTYRSKTRASSGGLGASPYHSSPLWHKFGPALIEINKHHRILTCNVKRVLPGQMMNPFTNSAHICVCRPRLDTQMVRFEGLCVFFSGPLSGGVRRSFPSNFAETSKPRLGLCIARWKDHSQERCNEYTHIGHFSTEMEVVSHLDPYFDG